MNNYLYFIHAYATLLVGIYRLVEGKAMDIQGYLKRAEYIREKEFWGVCHLADAMGMHRNTWQKVKATPDKCSSLTFRKIKAFVDKWEAKNLKAIA